MSLDTRTFTDHMYNYFGDYWDVLNMHLVEAEAVIAGGSVLSAYSDDSVNDIDVYIYASKAIKFVNMLTYKKYRLIKTHLRSSYDQSFFRKNNILARFLLQQDFPNVLPIGITIDTTRREAIEKRVIFPDIDIMIIPDPPNGLILDVVTNFDLTFCEIWYDGMNVNAQDPKGIMSKTGVLKKDYVDELLVSLNNFTLRRVQKYINKGYSITYECQRRINTFEKKAKNVVSPEEWIVHKLYNYIVFSARENRKESLKIICTYPLFKYTLKNFKEILPDLVRKMLQPSFLNGINTNKDLYMKILIQAGVKKYPPEYFRHVINILNITRADLAEYEERHIIYSRSYVPKWKGGDGPLQSDVDAFEFEEADDIDESLMRIEPGKVSLECFDIIMREYKDVDEYLTETNTFLLINKGNSDDDFDIMCFTKEQIEMSVSDKTEWFYECTAPPERYWFLRDGRGNLTENFNKPMDMFGDEPYVKMTIDSSGLNGFIPLIQLKKLLQSDHKIYYIVTNDSISHTINYQHSWQRLNGGNVVGTISANDCQYGSSILISNLKICKNQEKCLKSISFLLEETSRLFEDTTSKMEEDVSFEDEESDSYNIIGPLSEDEIKEIIIVQRTYNGDSGLRFMKRKYGTNFILHLKCKIDCVRDIPVINPPIKDLSVIASIGIKLLFLEIHIDDDSKDRQVSSDSYDNRVINVITKTIEMLPSILSFNITGKYISFEPHYFNKLQDALLKKTDLFSLTLSGVRVPCMLFISFLQKIPLLTELSLDNCNLDIPEDSIFDEEEFSNEFTKALRNIVQFKVSNQTYINQKRQLKYMWESLEKATNLKSLILQNNDLFDFNDNKLVAGDSYEYQEGNQEISGLHHLTQLTFLDVSFNYFLSSDNDDAISMFCSLISNLTNLESLNLKKTDIDSEAFDQILHSLGYLPNLTYLNIALNQELTEEHFTKIRIELPNITTLVVIDDDEAKTEETDEYENDEDEQED